MTIEAIHLRDRRHAIVVLTGTPEPGCGRTLGQSLQVSARAHTIVDLRQVEGITPEAVKPLLSALGQAIDRGRTLRVVVRSDRQRRFLEALGLKGMIPMHDSIAEAVSAADYAIAEAAQSRRTRVDTHH